MNDLLSWFLGGSGSAIWVRAGLAVLVLVVMAAVDIARRGREATRWKDYLFLLVSTAAAVAFAIGNDMVTVTVSPLYFACHERVALTDLHDIRQLAVGVAARGSWWVGLVLGVALLMMNNPRKTLGQLPWRRMYAKLLYLLVFAAVGSSGMGLLSWTGAISLPGDLDRAMVGAREVNTVFASHSGAYVGGAVGAILAAVQVIRQRKEARNQAQCAEEAATTAPEENIP